MNLDGGAFGSTGNSDNPIWKTSFILILGLFPVNTNCSLQKLKQVKTFPFEGTEALKSDCTKGP